MSLSKVYDIGLKHALQNIKRNGGSVSDDIVRIRLQQPKPVRYEQSFAGLYPSAKIPVTLSATHDEATFDFEGTGFVLRGESAEWGSESPYVFNTDLLIDGVVVEHPQLPASYTTRRYELCWKYDLLPGKHHVSLKILNPSASRAFNVSEAIIYTNHRMNGTVQNLKAASQYSSNHK
jgi:hypothetical protein